MKLKLVIVALAVFGWSPPLRGQSFPNRPIELVVSSSPGGGVDLVFRLIAEDLAKNLKTQVNVVNQTAGAGAIAAEKVAGARKDGYTLLGSLLGQVATMTVANPKGAGKLGARFSAAGDFIWLRRSNHARASRFGDQDDQRSCRASSKKTGRSDRSRRSAGHQPDLGS